MDNHQKRQRINGYSRNSKKPNQDSTCLPQVQESGEPIEKQRQKLLMTAGLRDGVKNRQIVVGRRSTQTAADDCGVIDGERRQEVQSAAEMRLPVERELLGEE